MGRLTPYRLLYGGYRPFSEKCEDEKEGEVQRKKTPGKRAPKCKTPEVEVPDGWGECVWHSSGHS